MMTESSTPPIEPEITAALLQRYDRPGPRYTSYPPANVWRSDFQETPLREALERASASTGPLSLYVHIPFCETRCAYCGCNVIVSRKPGVEDKYLDYVEKELDILAGYVGHRPLAQLHWGGGTPTFLAPQQIERMFEAIRSRFAFVDGAEIALETDPRVTTDEQLELLRRLGFNRVSMGVQDFDPAVQEAIGRYQTEEQTRRSLERCRRMGFQGVNVDLIYGLPAQSVEKWDRTLAVINELRPDRLAVYSYAHLPAKLHHQRRIDENALPSQDTKLALLVLTRKRLIEGGYRAIGMDHFALPDDELTRAMDNRRLRRNFMGYAVMPGDGMIAAGVSSISDIGGVYAQNTKKLSTYYEALDAGRLPIHAGHVLTDDDQVRRWVIHEVMCNFAVDYAEFEGKWGRSFPEYFTVEQADLQALAEDGFIRQDGERLIVLPVGRVFVRNIAMVFDACLRRRAGELTYSRTV